MKKYTIKYGDSVRMIAQRELGDADRWEELVEHNKLQYPFISPSPSKGVLTPGDVIEIPEENDNEVQPDTTLGTDLYLSSDKTSLTNLNGGDLSVGADGDYKLLYEMDSFRQDIRHRKMTPVGTLPYHPSYGSEFATMVGSKKMADFRVKAELELERMLRCDPRVSDVPSISIQDIPTGVSLNYTAVVKNIVITGVVEDEEI